MLRRLTIGLGALGVVLVVYGLYRSHNPAPPKTAAPVPTITLSPATSSAPASQARSLAGLASITLAPGGNLDITVYDPRGQLQYLLQADEWSPSGQNGDQIDVSRPSLSKFMRDGQILQVTASQGQIHVEPVGKGSFKPKRGTLTKDVEIRIDLTTSRWRLDHPEQQAMDLHAEHVIVIRMDTLYFDDDLSLIRTDGPVTVHSDKFDIASKGLRLVYSRPQDRLDRLEVFEGGTIELRGAIDLATNPLLGTASAGSPKASLIGGRGAAADEESADQSETAATMPATTDGSAAVEEEVAQEPTTARAMEPDSDVPPQEALALARQSGAQDGDAPTTAPASPRFVDVYQARFEGPVHVEQSAGEKTVARLDADQLLDLTFDLGAQGRGRSVGTGSTEKSAASQPAEPQSRVVMTWAGRLDISAVDRRVADKAGRTAAIHAAGQKVVLSDDENTVECMELYYDAAHRSGRVLATAPGMARIADARGRYVAGHDIRFDLRSTMTGTLEIVGAGEAAEPGGDQLLVGGRDREAAEGLTRIAWHRGLSMRFRRGSLMAGLSMTPPLPLRMPQGAGASLAMYQGVFALPHARPTQSFAAGPLSGLIAQSASITGNALVQRGRESICSEQLDITFFAPAGEGPVFGPILAARGTGGVNLTSQGTSSDRQSITSEELDVSFERVAANRSIPTRALASGKAVVTQGTAKIEADRIDAELGPVADGEAAAATQTEKARSQPKVAVRKLLATGNVRIRDPKQLDLTAERLVAFVEAGQVISRVEIDGTKDQPAVVSTAEYSIAAPAIVGNLRTEDVAVPSAGSLTLRLRQDLQGEPLNKPRPLVITWTDHMRMEGEKNLAEFVGQVRAIQSDAATGRTEMDMVGDRMAVYLRPAGPVATQPAESPTVGRQLAKLLDKTRQQVTEVFPTTDGWLPESSGSDSLTHRAGTSREPVRIVLDGKAMATLPRFDATGKILTSRLLVVGPKFEIDLPRQQMEVEGKGNLLVENYALATLANDPRAANPQALAAAASDRPDSGLSQTVFTWHNAMLFILPQAQAVFDGQVNMIHLAGGRIRFGAEMAEALGAKIDLLKAMPGRDATLNCDSLCVQFSQAGSKTPGGDSQWMQRGKLENLAAEGRLVTLEEHRANGGTNMVTAGRLQYSSQRDTFVVQRSASSAARIIVQPDAAAISQTHEADTIYWERNSDKGPGHERIVIQNARGSTRQ